METSPNTREATIEDIEQVDSWSEPMVRVGRAVIELFAHLLVVASLLCAIRLLEGLVRWLWGGNEVLFFERIPLRYVFDGADLALLTGFLLYGVWSVIRAYMKKKVRT